MLREFSLLKRLEGWSESVKKVKIFAENIFSDSVESSARNVKNDICRCKS